MRFLMVGDVHVSDRPPSTRTTTYREDILKKLIEIGSIADEHSCDAVVFVGDIFHSKKPQNTSHQTVRAVSQILGSYSVQVYIVPGNHDYAGRQHKTLANHPLGTVSLMPNVTLFGTDDRRRVKHGHVTMFGVREEEPISRFGDALENEFVVAHYAIFPPGGAPLVWEAHDADMIAGQFGYLPSAVWYGHIHEPHGQYRAGRDNATLFVNLGAISRGSLHEEGARTRIPEVGIIEFADDGSVSEVFAVKLRSARPAAQVFRIEEVEQERAEAAETNAFVEAMSKAEVEVFSVESAVQAISEASDVPEDVKDRAIDLIRAVTG